MTIKIFFIDWLQNILIKRKEMYKFIIFISTLFCTGGSMAASASTPALNDLPLQDSLTTNGITWKLNQPVRVGKFVNGDCYVVGPCTVTAISPAPTATPARNGSILNIHPDDMGTAFDDRVQNYHADVRRYPPIAMKPGDALVSSISVTDQERDNIKVWLSPGKGGTCSGIRTAGVLTCVAAPLPTDAFRPGYCDRGQKIYHTGSLRWDLLPNLKRVNSMTPEKLHEWSTHFYKSPWLDVCFFGFDAPVDYMPHYAAEIGRAVGIGTLLLVCDFTKAEKESLMIGLVQYGIDLWGIARGCNASRGWHAHGGHGTGRKWAIMFSGIILGDQEMAAPTKTYPELRFGEDMQTMYGTGWTGAKVLYAGHLGMWHGQPVSKDPAQGPYEHLRPGKWASDMNENYRHCCTSHTWVSQGLAARLMGAQGLWDHPAFFDYCDRWMTESDKDANAAIKAERGQIISEYAYQGQTWDAITNEMWKVYRNNPAGDKPEKK
jgi:hypothetical protein